MISLVIPVLKRDGFLEECLSSIGSHPDVEVVVVEGVSPVGEARNQGLKRARGEWVWFVDGDDVLADGWLDVVHRMMSENPRTEVFSFGLSCTLPLPRCRCGEIRSVDVSRRLPYEMFGRLLPQFIFRMDLARKFRFQEFVRGEDKLFLGGALLATDGVCVCDAVLYGYRQHGGSAMHQPWTPRNFGDELEWRIRWMAMLEASGKQDDWRSRRMLGLSFLEYMPFALRGTSLPLRNELAKLWRTAVKRAAGYRFSLWHRVALKALAVTPNAFFVWFFCRLPFDVKQFLRRGGGR